MSISRILAAFSGTAVLGQNLVLHEWPGIAIIGPTNTVAIWLAGRKKATLTA
jgi:threonine/homoserine efflux transporter RhtA